MAQCPYRKEHEWDEKGLCRHCYAPRDEPHRHNMTIGSFNQDTVACRCGATISGLQLLSAGVQYEELEKLPTEQLEALVEYLEKP